MQHLPIDVLVRVADAVATYTMAGVCRTWYAALSGRYVSLRGVAAHMTDSTGGGLLAWLADALITDRQRLRVLHVDFGAPRLTSKHPNDPELCVCTALSHLVCAGNRPPLTSLWSFQLTLTRPAQPHMVPIGELFVAEAVDRAVQRMIGGTKSMPALRDVRIDTVGRCMCAGSWPRWVAGLPRGPPMTQLSLGPLTPPGTYAAADEGTAYRDAILCFLPFGSGLRALTLQLDGAWVGLWLRHPWPVQAGDDAPDGGCYSLRTLSLTFTGQPNAVMRGSMVPQLLTTTIHALPSLTDLTLCVDGRCEYDRPNDDLGPPRPMLPPFGTALRGVTVRMDYTRASAARLAAVLQTLLALPDLERATVMAVGNEIDVDTNSFRRWMEQQRVGESLDRRRHCLCRWYVDLSGNRPACTRGLLETLQRFTEGEVQVVAEDRPRDHQQQSDEAAMGWNFDPTSSTQRDIEDDHNEEVWQQ